VSLPEKNEEKKNEFFFFLLHFLPYIPYRTHTKRKMKRHSLPMTRVDKYTCTYLRK